MVSAGGKGTVESWYVTLITRADALEKIQNEITPHGPCIDASISSMMSDAGYALDFKGIKEKDINETEFGLRLDKLGKAAIKKEHLGTLSSLNAFIGFAKEYKPDHEKTLQAASSVMNSAELRMKHTPCPPMDEVNSMLAKFIDLARKIKEKGRIVLEDHLM